MMTIPKRSVLALTLLLLVGTSASPRSPQAYHVAASSAGSPAFVRGWNILSDSETDGMTVIAAAHDYAINHLQLSHQIVHDLRQVREEPRRGLVNRFTAAAHGAGIDEVVLWDHSFYDLDYYPQRFRTGPAGTIDLDQPEFWEWLKSDYRTMLNLVPEVDGLVLTFVETGARAERQHSRKMTTNAEKLAAVVNAVADVVVGERKLALYARTFAYTHEEYANLVGAIRLFNRPEVRLMMKETPHDFFLTHPNDFFAGTIARPTIIEFDAAGEFNGQGIIASAWPEYILQRWRSFARRDHVIGYVARTDRYGPTRILGRPSEINLLALARGAENREVTAEEVYDEFIAKQYGKDALPDVKRAFKNSFEIVTSILYTLGTNTANHSQLNYDPYGSSYTRHVSGKWFDPAVVQIDHGVDRDFHYWKDVIAHLAPVWAKPQHGGQWGEVPWVVRNGWVPPGELMTEEYLRYILAEKDFGVAKARESVEAIEAAQTRLTAAKYEDLHHYFARTLLTARLHRAVAGAYFGFRIYARGEGFRTPSLRAILNQTLQEIKAVSDLITTYPVKPAVGQWDWATDARQAMTYLEWITVSGWPKETRKVANPQHGTLFPFQEGSGNRVTVPVKW